MAKKPAGEDRRASEAARGIYLGMLWCWGIGVGGLLHNFTYSQQKNEETINGPCPLEANGRGR